MGNPIILQILKRTNLSIITHNEHASRRPCILYDLANLTPCRTLALNVLDSLMRVVIQRVSSASVSIDQNIHSSIQQGLLVLLGIENRDSKEDIDWLCQKIVKMRIFEDHEGVMNKALADINGEILVISQFTLHAQTKKGNRPSYIKAARPEQAIPLYEQFLESLTQLTQHKCQAGKFGADMQVSLVNDGPVTITIDSQNRE